MYSFNVTPSNDHVELSFDTFSNLLGHKAIFVFEVSSHTNPNEEVNYIMEDWMKNGINSRLGKTFFKIYLQHLDKLLEPELYDNDRYDSAFE